MADLFIGYENGQKKIIPTSSEARSGNPLGTILALHSNAVPYGYLPCNGVAFDENQYPALYALLGDNHTPDLRECNLVGAGQSERTILDDAGHAHDVYTIGQFKDDQIQDFNISYNTNYSYVGAGNNSAYSKYVSGLDQKISFTSNDIRAGTTTHGKNVGVNYVIKATSGLEETQQDYVLQSLLEADNYSTDEVATGKKWIDGKMIYRKVFYDVSLTNGLELLTGVSELIKQYGTMTHDNTIYIPFPKDAGTAFCTARLNTSTHKVAIDASNTYSGRVILEYTKAD